MNADLDRAELLRALRIAQEVSRVLDQQRDSRPTFAGRKFREGWEKRTRSVEADAASRLAIAGALINQRPDGAHIAFAGVEAHSAAGLTQALRKWKEAAERRLNDMGEPA